MQTSAKKEKVRVACLQMTQENLYVSIKHM